MASNHGYQGARAGRWSRGRGAADGGWSTGGGGGFGAAEEGDSDEVGGGSSRTPITMLGLRSRLEAKAGRMGVGQLARAAAIFRDLVYEARGPGVAPAQRAELMRPAFPALALLLRALLPQVGRCCQTFLSKSCTMPAIQIPIN